MMEQYRKLWRMLPMAEKKKILYIVEAMGGGVFTYIVALANEVVSKAGAIGRVAFNGKIPMFYTPHGYSFLMENYKPMKRRMFKVIESVCAKRNCTTISCSVGEHQESLKLTKHATYVNNGINMAELQEIIDKTEKVEHPFTVYTLGRICYQKNPTLFNDFQM